MNNKMLIPTILVAVAALSGIGLVSFYDIDPKWTLLQGCALVAGTCLMLAIQLLGWSRILALAPAAYLTVCILCAACFLGPSFEGAHRGLSLFGHRVFYPAHFAPLAVVCILAWHQQHKSRTSVILASAALPAMIVMVMPYLSLFTLITAILCILAYPVLSSRPNAHAKGIVAVLCAYLLAIKFAPVLRGRHTLAGYIFHGEFDFLHRNLIDVLGKCSWFGYGNGDYLTYTLNPIWENAHVHCAYVMGLWAFIAVLLLFVLLGTCLCLAYRRTEPGPRKTLVLGCSLVLLLPPLFSFAWLIFAFPGHGNIIPFLSMGGSTTLASFSALGILLAALRGEAVDNTLPHEPKKMLALNLLLALSVGFSLTIGLTQHPPKPSPWFMVPNPPMPKLPPPIFRGRILAADNSVLAYTTNRWEIRIDPRSPMGNTNVWTKPRIATALSKELDLPYTNLIAHLNNPKNRYIFLKETRDADLIDRLSKHAKDWRLIIERYQGRVYPLGEMAAHYVGAAGKSGTFYWEQRPLRGMFGVEYTQNETLADGQDIRLPLVPSLQTNLWSIVSRLKERYDANAAWAIAVTATNRTACILAMAKCPSYNPERYGSYREPQWENAPARFTFSLSDFTNSLAPPISTNTQAFGSALQLARAVAIQAAEGNDIPLRVTSSAPSERPGQDVVALLVRRDKHALVVCVRAPLDAKACERELASLRPDDLL